MRFPVVFSRLPLPFKILLWFFLNLVLLAAGFLLIFRAEYRFDLDWIFSSHVQQRVDAMRDLIVDDLDARVPDEWDDVIDRFAAAYHVHLGLFDDRGRHLLGSVDDLPAEVRIRLRPGSEPTARAFVRTDNPTRYWLVAGARVENQRTGGPLTLHVVAESSSASMGGLVIDPAPWLRLGAGAVVCSLLFWLPLLRGITRAIGQVTHTAREIAQGRLDARVASRRRDELGVLAEAINTMAARLDGLLHGQKRFLSDVAHELCAPLAKLQMTLGIIEQRAADDDRQHAYARTAMEKAEQMARLVDELLVFSRASLAAPTVQPQLVNVLAAAREAVVHESAEAHAVQLDIPPGLEVLADPAALTRALANLLRNALRYGGGQPGTVKVQAAADGDSPLLPIVVSDRGSGVPEADLPKIFDAFYRVDTARTRETGGVGLGLSIVKNSVEAAGGTISAQNRPEGGLEVTLRLPKA